MENPEYFIPEDVAEKFRKRRKLEPFDIVTPTRASKNIGLFGMIMPWQTKAVLTRENEIWRVLESDRIDPYLLLSLMSLRVVHDQFKFLVLMQMNQEDLSTRYRELLLPIPKSPDVRDAWSKPVHDYISLLVRARKAYDELGRILNPELFVDRP